MRYLINMGQVVIVGLATEGNTDIRFLESVVQRTFERIAMDCKGQIEVMPVWILPKQSGTVEERALKYLDSIEKHGIMIFCLHADADNSSADKAQLERVLPLFQLMEQEESSFEKIAIIPVYMTEAWMLADKNLIKEELGTNKSNQDLGLHKRPELYSDPKAIIKTAINIATSHLPQRRQRISISDLYQIIGSKIALGKLEDLESYLCFQNDIREAFVKMNYL